MVEQRDDGDHGEEDQPEPEEDVDLLVHDVDGQDADGVVRLHGAGGAVLEEAALGHPREDDGHGVDALLRVGLQELEDAEAVGGELPAEEGVHEVDAPHHVDEVEELHEEHLERPEVVRVHALHHVVRQDSLLLGAVLLAQDDLK